jgi:hypothetical protein
MSAVTNLYIIKQESAPVSCNCRKIQYCDHKDLYTTINVARKISPSDVQDLQSRGEQIYKRNADGKFEIYSPSRSDRLESQDSSTYASTAAKVEKCSNRKYCDCSNCQGMW